MIWRKQKGGQMALEVRAVDKSKRSNMKCEYCEHFDKENCKCYITGETKYYYNRARRCKSFEWTSKKQYKVTEKAESKDKRSLYVLTFGGFK